MPAELTFRFLIDGPPASHDFVDATVGVSCRGFAGASRFTIARRDLAAFSRDVTALAQGDADIAQLLGGWDAAAERLRLRVMRAGTTGSFAVSIRIANTGPRGDQWDRVETQFICAGDALASFADTLASGEHTSVQLLGDAESAA